MNEQQYFEQFSGEDTHVVLCGIIPVGRLLPDGTIISEEAIEGLMKQTHSITKDEQGRYWFETPPHPLTFVHSAQGWSSGARSSSE